MPCPSHPLSCLASQTQCEFAVGRQYLGQNFWGLLLCWFPRYHFSSSEKWDPQGPEATRASGPLTSLHQLIPASGVPPAPELSQLRAPRPVPITTVLSGLAEPGAGGGALLHAATVAGQPTLRAGLDTQGLLEEGWEGLCSNSAQLSVFWKAGGPAADTGVAGQGRWVGPEEALRGLEKGGWARG